MGYTKGKSVFLALLIIFLPQKLLIVMIIIKQINIINYVKLNWMFWLMLQHVKQGSCLRFQ